MLVYEGFYEDKWNIIWSLIESCFDFKVVDCVFEVLVEVELFLDFLFWLLSEIDNFNKIYDLVLKVVFDVRNSGVRRKLFVLRVFSEIIWGRRGKMMEFFFEVEKIEVIFFIVFVGEKGKCFFYFGFYYLVIG